MVHLKNKLDKLTEQQSNDSKETSHTLQHEDEWIMMNWDDMGDATTKPLGKPCATHCTCSLYSLYVKHSNYWGHLLGFTAGE